MNLFFTALGALPLGLLVGRRHWALFTYLLVDSFFFSFQTLNVLLTWMSGGKGSGAVRGSVTPRPAAFPSTTPRATSSRTGS
jgi:hypothetical protein